jgi:hypothetical protein
MPRNPHGRRPPPTIVSGSVDSDGARAEAEPPATHTFLLRIWKERREGAGRRPLWRGTVSDLRGHHLGSFSSVAELVEIFSGTSNVVVLLRHGDDGVDGN